MNLTARSNIIIHKKKIFHWSNKFHHILITAFLQGWGYSSVVEHSTADREVPGSIPGVPWP